MLEVFFVRYAIIVSLTFKEMRKPNGWYFTTLEGTGHDES